MNSPSNTPTCNCRCCLASRTPTISVEAGPEVSRRRFLYHVSAVTLGGLALPSLVAEAVREAGAGRGPLPRAPLRVQPVFTYSTPQRREATSWRDWGGVHTDAAAAAEQERIRGELAKLQAKADFPVEILPLKPVRNRSQAAEIVQGKHDLLLMYAAGGGGDVLEAMTSKDRWNLMFLRHEPGPVYLWYEIAHPRFLRKTVDEYGQPGMDVHDVVVDSQDELLWRMRGLHGLKNTLHKRIVCIGGAAGWGTGGQQAPELARTLWKLDLQDFPYQELAPRLKAARQDSALTKRCADAALRYLGSPRTSLLTTQAFVNNAFVLFEVLKDIMAEAHTDALTINSCMGTIMPMSETTAACR